MKYKCETCENLIIDKDDKSFPYSCKELGELRSINYKYLFEYCKNSQERMIQEILERVQRIEIAQQETQKLIKQIKKYMDDSDEKAFWKAVEKRDRLE